MKNKLGTTEDMIEYHENGNKSYEFRTYVNGLIAEITFDKNGKTLNYQDLIGGISLYTRDEQGNKVAYKNSNGYYEVNNKQVTQQEYEAFIQSLGNPDEKARKLVDKFKDFPAIIDQLLKQQEIEDNLHNKIKTRQNKQTTMKNKLGTTEDMIEYHDNGKESYEFRTDSYGFSEELTFDKHERILTIKNSNGYSCEFTRDEQGKKLAYKDSNGYYEIKRKKVTQEEYEAFIQELENKQTVVQELEKPKTAMQELIDYMKTYFYLTDESLEMFDQALEKEKHQTLLGVYEGQKNHSASDEENKIMAEHWYQETFKQKK